MALVTSAARSRQRNLLFLGNPHLWVCWPFLPVVRLSPDGCGTQCGILYDARGMCGRYGYSATVFLSNLFLLPRTEAEFFALPKLVYDTADEIADDGWRVD